MVNDNNSKVIAEISAIRFNIEGMSDEEFNTQFGGNNLKDIINNQRFQESHADDKDFQSFMQNVTKSPDTYTSALSDNTFFATKYDAATNHNGLAVLTSDNQVVIGSNPTDPTSLTHIGTDIKMAFGTGVPDYFKSGLSFTKDVKDMLARSTYSSVTDINFVGQSLAGASAVYARVMNEGIDDRFTYGAKVFEAFGLDQWESNTLTISQ
ncbi:MAG TPA: hypothetical protein DD381_06800, partial [Lentisphaeria bacterium]|nr:hypothetical protein [Lentisphaeria bacterium]